MKPLSPYSHRTLRLAFALCLAPTLGRTQSIPVLRPLGAIGDRPAVRLPNSLASVTILAIPAPLHGRSTTRQPQTLLAPTFPQRLGNLEYLPRLSAQALRFLQPLSDTWVREKEMLGETPKSHYVPIGLPNYPPHGIGWDIGVRLFGLIGERHCR